MERQDEEKDFKSFCVDRMKKLFDEVLYSVETSVRSEYQYSVLRKRILRSGNNALRDMLKEIDDYSMEHNPVETRTEKYEID